MTILDALKSYVKYPLGSNLIEVIAIKRGLKTSEQYSKEVSESTAFIGARADCLRELVIGPSISQGGVSISVDDKDNILIIANDLYRSLGETAIGEAAIPTVTRIDL